MILKINKNRECKKNQLKSPNRSFFNPLAETVLNEKGIAGETLFYLAFATVLLIMGVTGIMDTHRKKQTEKKNPVQQTERMPEKKQKTEPPIEIQKVEHLIDTEQSKVPNKIKTLETKFNELVCSDNKIRLFFEKCKRAFSMSTIEKFGLERALKKKEGYYNAAKLACEGKIDEARKLYIETTQK